MEVKIINEIQFKISYNDSLRIEQEFPTKTHAKTINDEIRWVFGKTYGKYISVIGSGNSFKIKIKDPKIMANVLDDWEKMVRPHLALKFGIFNLFGYP